MDKELEKAANNWVTQPVIGTRRESFMAGATWQAERMYSEEEVLNLWDWLNDGFIIRKSLPTREELIGWFEQFKNK